MAVTRKLPSQIEIQLSSFLKPKIKFNTVYQHYSYNNNWLIDVTENSLKKDSLKIVTDVNNHLSAGENTKAFLRSLLSLIETRLEFYEEKKTINDIGFVEYKISNIDSVSSGDVEEPKPEKFDVSDIIKEEESVIERIHEEESYYYNIFRFKGAFNNYTNSLDLEHVKLNYVIGLHNDYALKLFQYLLELLEDHENVNFDQFDFQTLLVRYDFIDSPQTVQKCQINYSKIDVANLFHLLHDEKIFVFDKNERQNKILMQIFIEQNFTYKDDDGFQKNIAFINKQLSKVGFSNTLSHKNFLDSLILRLQERRINLL